MVSLKVHKAIAVLLLGAAIATSTTAYADDSIVVIEGLDEVNQARAQSKSTTSQKAIIGINNTVFKGNNGECYGYFEQGCEVTLTQLGSTLSTVQYNGLTGLVDTMSLITDAAAMQSMIDSLNLRKMVIASFDGMPIRANADIVSGVIQKTQAGESYNWVADYGDYYQIELDSGIVCFLKKDYASVTYDYPRIKSNTEEDNELLVSEDVILKTKTIGEQSASHPITSSPSYYYNYNNYQFRNSGNSNVPNIPINGTGETTDLRKSIVSFAISYVGNRYVWGGEDLDNGVDCSGFVMRIYEHFGYSINRVAEDQANNGIRVDPYSVQPGDLIFFAYEDGYIYHVGMYIGGGQYVNASNSADYPIGGVKIANYDPSSVYCAVDIIDSF